MREPPFIAGKRVSRVGNFLAFQATWLATVLGAANGLVWLGPLVLACWLAIHLTSTGRGEANLLGLAAVIGFGFDSLLSAVGIIEFPNSGFVTAPSPLWMICLWVAFACTLRHSLAWLRPYPLLASAFGAVGGSLAYLGGAQLGALVVSASPISLLVVAAMWAIVTPTLFTLAERVPGTKRGTQSRGSIGESI
jgi:hypothetical protein